MAQTSINVRTDSELKQDFAKLCGDRGLSVSAAINEIMKISVQKKELPIGDLESDDYFVDDEELKRRYEQARAGIGLVDFDYRNI